MLLDPGSEYDDAGLVTSELQAAERMLFGRWWSGGLEMADNCAGAGAVIGWEWDTR